MSDSNQRRRVVVTGIAPGVGAAVATKLRARGDVVIGVDLHVADVIAALAAPEG